MTHPHKLRNDAFSPRTIQATGTLTTTETAPRGEMREGFAREYATRLPCGFRV
jgi:hypothetical protein